MKHLFTFYNNISYFLFFNWLHSIPQHKLMTISEIQHFNAFQDKKFDFVLLFLYYITFAFVVNFPFHHFPTFILLWHHFHTITISVFLFSSFSSPQSFWVFKKGTMGEAHYRPTGDTRTTGGARWWWRYGAELNGIPEKWFIIFVEFPISTENIYVY